MENNNQLITIKASINFLLNSFLCGKQSEEIEEKEVQKLFGVDSLLLHS